MFEHHKQPLLPLGVFLIRVTKHFGFALLIIFVALFIGVLGYHAFEGMSWVDAIVNAAMILGGMGPVSELHTNAGKLFAAAYALFSGLGFIVIIGVLFAPFIHRFFHKLHLDAETNEKTDEI
jgi:hypothetical protein